MGGCGGGGGGGDDAADNAAQAKCHQSPSEQLTTVGGVVVGGGIQLNKIWLGLCFSLCCIIGHTLAGYACLSNPCVFGVCIDDLNR